MDCIDSWIDYRLLSGITTGGYKLRLPPIDQLVLTTDYWRALYRFANRQEYIILLLIGSHTEKKASKPGINT